jgi:hypothetical protein
MRDHLEAPDNFPDTGGPDVTQNRSDAAEYQALPNQSSKIADAASPEATNLALPRQSFARGSLFPDFLEQP